MLNILKKYKRELIASTFIGPNFIGYGIFNFIPIIFTFILAFSSYHNISGLTFVGLDNFTGIFKDSTFWISLWNTVYYTAGTVPLTMICSLLLAILINQKVPGIKYFRLGIYFPYITSIVAIAIVWNILYHPTDGFININLQALGISNPPGWTSDQNWAMPAVIITSVWKDMGYYMIIYLAGLQGIPKDLYEAASIDGANGVQQFINITIPGLAHATFFVMVMSTINCFRVFDLILNMTGGGPGRSTNVLVYKIYTEAFYNVNYGYAAATSFILLIIVLGITYFQFRFEKKLY